MYRPQLFKKDPSCPKKARQDFSQQPKYKGENHPTTFNNPIWLNETKKDSRPWKCRCYPPFSHLVRIPQSNVHEVSPIKFVQIYPLASSGSENQKVVAPHRLKNWWLTLLTFANYPGNYMNMRASVSVFTGFLQTFNQKPVSQNINLSPSPSPSTNIFWKNRSW